jgi:hypothetical protein
VLGVELGGSGTEKIDGNIYTRRKERLGVVGDSGTLYPPTSFIPQHTSQGSSSMHGLIYLVGLIVVILAILSFFGLR